MQAPDSLIYDELHENRNLTNENGYVLPDSNVLLKAYFADISVGSEARRLQARGGGGPAAART